MSPRCSRIGSTGGQSRDSTGQRATVQKFWGGLPALHGLSLESQPGERRVILWPNGAGKTTLFNLIGGQLSPPRDGASSWVER
jgi:ABC-type branched-subunit amino acid transport system ATPase component